MSENTPNSPEYCLDHHTLLATHDLRIANVEEAVLELRKLAEKSDERLDGQDVSLAEIKKALSILLPVVYGILSVSVLAFLGALFNYFIGK